MNRLFVGYKRAFISSNSYLNTIKKKFNIKKIGYSGTLDPFASGILVLASGSYTRLLNHITLEPKVYRATLWLGAKSDSLDITSKVEVKMVSEFSLDSINRVLDSLIGRINYIPPKFSAKKINGIRAYKLARSGESVELKECKVEIFDIKVLNYNHPFLSFEVSVSKGAYIRSLGEIVASKLGVNGILSNLIRIKEGDFSFEGYKFLDPLSLIKYPKIDLNSYYNDVKNGKEITLKQSYKNTTYIANFEDFFSIIRINDYKNVEYILNRIPKC